MSNSRVKLSGRELMYSGYKTPSFSILSQRPSMPSSFTISPDELVFQVAGKSPISVVEKSSIAITFSPETKSNLL